MADDRALELFGWLHLFCIVLRFNLYKTAEDVFFTASLVARLVVVATIYILGKLLI